MRALRLGIALLVAVALGAGILAGPRLLRMLDVGSGYVAKQTCSCLFVAGRSFEACRADQPSSMDRIRAARLADREGVRAGMLGFERTALHHPGSGCALVE